MFHWLLITNFSVKVEFSVITESDFLLFYPIVYVKHNSHNIFLYRVQFANLLFSKLVIGDLVEEYSTPEMSEENLSEYQELCLISGIDPTYLFHLIYISIFSMKISRYGCIHFYCFGSHFHFSAFVSPLGFWWKTLNHY